MSPFHASETKISNMASGLKQWSVAFNVGLNIHAARESMLYLIHSDRKQIIGGRGTELVGG